MKKLLKDVFGLWQIKDALSGSFRGKYQFPCIEGTSRIPESLVAFSKRKKETDTKNKAIHFYEYDEKFVKVFESEKKLDAEIENFKKYKCVILPDFSVYRDMPLAMQIFQIYKNRAAGFYLEKNGIKIIPNIRWGDERTYEFAFEGIKQWGIVAVGVLGAYKNKDNAYYFEKGFMKMLDVIDPETVLCYGKLSEGLKAECNLRKINVKEYETEISKRTKICDEKTLKLFL